MMAAVSQIDICFVFYVFTLGYLINVYYIHGYLFEGKNWRKIKFSQIFVIILNFFCHFLFHQTIINQNQS